MGDITKGIESGFIATVVISILLLVQQMTGAMPAFDPVGWYNVAAGTTDHPAMGWILNFVTGAVAWGSLFAVLSPHLPGPHWFRGLVLGCITWLLMMVVFMPSAGMAMFAQDMGIGIAIISLVFNLVFGLVLGETYHLLLHYLPSEVDENA